MGFQSEFTRFVNLEEDAEGYDFLGGDLVLDDQDDEEFDIA